MKRGLLALFLMLPAMVFGQVSKRLTQVVSTNNFAKINKYLDSLHRKNESQKLIAYPYLKRDVVSGYEVRAYEITEYVDGSRGQGKIADITHLYLVVSNKQLVFSQISYSTDPRIKTPTFKVPVIYVNDSLNNALKAAFMTDFEAPLDSLLLFGTDVVYGSRCGYAGVNPYWQNVTDSLVDNNNRIGLMQLLQSTTTEKQVYGVQGFNKLTEKGLVLTETEQRIIKNVLRKKGDIRTCSGCTYWREDLQKLFKRRGFK